LWKSLAAVASLCLFSSSKRDIFCYFLISRNTNLKKFLIKSGALIKGRRQMPFPVLARKVKELASQQFLQLKQLLAGILPFPFPFTLHIVLAF
jgi:hypothetical protein